MREYVYCAETDCCHGDHHGWSCPMSDPLGDCLRILMDPNPNPILEQVRRDMLRTYGVEVR